MQFEIVFTFDNRSLKNIFLEIYVNSTYQLNRYALEKIALSLWIQLIDSLGITLP